ncbi:MAG: PPC domain-containing protein, partial [Chryseobacterium sp.]|nr:PPC domain-containing protein [Chryseobacterium sp.]
FNLLQDQWIGFDQLANGIADTEWVIKDAIGNDVFTSNSTTVSDTLIAPKFLKKGSYTLKFNSLKNSLGEMTFQLKASSLVDGSLDENNKNLIITNDKSESKFIKIENKNNDILTLISEPYATYSGNSKYLDLDNVAERTIVSGFSEKGIELYELNLHKNDKFYLEKNRTDVLLRIFDRDGNEVVRTEQNELNFEALVDGVYYIGISSILNKNYNINESFNNERTENVLVRIKYDAYEKINNIDVGGSIYTAQKLDLVKAKNIQIVIGDNNSSYADVDFYKIQVKKGDVIDVSTPNGNGIDGYLKVFDKNGALLTQADDSPISYTFNMDGEYYLAFSAYDKRGYSPFSENTAGFGGGKGIINVNVKLNSAKSSKIFLLDKYGNIVLDTNINSPEILQQKLNKDEEYYVWINTSLENVPYYSYVLGISEKKTQQLDLSENNKLEYEFNGAGETHEVELKVTEAGTYFIDSSRNIGLNTSWTLSGLGIDDIKWNNEFLLNETRTQAVYLTKGVYKLTVFNYGVDGNFSLDFISSKSIQVLPENQEEVIDKLQPNGSSIYEIHSKYLDEYFFNIDSNSTNLNFIVWDQYGKVIS